MKNSEFSYDNISPKVKKRKTENYSDFEWIQKIKINLPKNLDLTAEKISEFRSGELLCKILSTLEARTIIGVQKAKKGSAAAVKNVSLAFDMLRSKPAFSSKVYFIENLVLSGSGPHIRMLLKEIYKLYRNAIVTLIKFNTQSYASTLSF